MSPKPTIKLILLSLCLITMLCSCGSGKIQTLDVSGMQEKLTQMGYWNDTFLGYSAAGISDCGGLINSSWSLYFYDYGNEKKALDDMMPIFIPDDANTYTVTKRSNYIIYEKVNEYGTYCLYVRADNTFLMMNGPGQDKEKIRDLATQLGYYK